MTPRPRPHILIAGQFPPPVTGFAYITQEMAKLIAQSYPTTIIDTSPHRKRGGLGYHLHRLALTLRGAAPLFQQAISNPSRIFYVAGESRLGLIYNIILCAVARLLNYKIYVHHHNFNYIDQYSKPMSVLLAIIGQQATHIFLCQRMADLFAARYNRRINAEILSNSAFVEIPPVQETPQPPRPLVIGLLSNLNNDKGLGLFLDLLRQAAKDKLNIKGILAGPPDTDAERAAIDAACRELGEQLDYRGSVYGEAKNAFFKDIDIFVFPTRYANEAQPTVVYEAMAHGIPALSYDRGCILSQIGTCGAVQKRDEDFIPFALSWLKELLSHPETLSELKLDARTAFLEDRAKSRQKATHLFETAARQ